MKQQQFEASCREDWQMLHEELEQGVTAATFPASYRRLCHQLALAKYRRYSPQLIDYLNDLVLRCHHRLYSHNSRHRHLFIRFFSVDFPRSLRASATYIYWACALFLLPGLLMGLACFWDESLIYSLMPAEEGVTLI